MTTLAPPPPAGWLIQRWSCSRSFVWAGSGAVVIGGLIAAVTRPLKFSDGSWVAAYLVLVAGTSQIALGAGQAILTLDPPLPSTIRLETIGWNLGATVTIVGTLIGEPVITTVGAAVTTITLAMFLATTRRTVDDLRTLAAVYRMLVAILLLSIPVGVALSWSRHR